MKLIPDMLLVNIVDYTGGPVLVLGSGSYSRSPETFVGINNDGELLIATINSRYR